MAHLQWHEWAHSLITVRHHMQCMYIGAEACSTVATAARAASLCHLPQRAHPGLARTAQSIGAARPGSRLYRAGWGMMRQRAGQG